MVVGTAPREAAQAAFAEGPRAAATTGALVVAALAIVAVVVLRRVGPGADAERPPGPGASEPTARIAGDGGETCLAAGTDGMDASLSLIHI